MQDGGRQVRIRYRRPAGSGRRATVLMCRPGFIKVFAHSENFTFDPVQFRLGPAFSGCVLFLPAPVIADGVQPGVPFSGETVPRTVSLSLKPFGAPDLAPAPPFFTRRLDAVRCALR